MHLDIYFTTLSLLLFNTWEKLTINVEKTRKFRENRFRLNFVFHLLEKIIINVWYFYQILTILVFSRRDRIQFTKFFYLYELLPNKCMTFFNLISFDKILNSRCKGFSRFSRYNRFLISCYYSDLKISKTICINLIDNRLNLNLLKIRKIVKYFISRFNFI